MHWTRHITSCLLGLGLASSAAAGTLDKVKKKGFVQCGVSQGLSGFSAPDKSGTWVGIDVDVCRALAAAIFDDPKKVKFTPLSAKERFTALQSGEVDVLSRNTTWTYTRDVDQGLEFAGVVYYDGQGFMVPKKLGVKSARDLDGATICVNLGTTTELNAADFFRKNKMRYKMLTFERDDETVAAYGAGRCDAITTDQSGLYSNRLKLKNPGEHMILPEIISKEPLGPAVRQGDSNWGDIVRWTVHVLVGAEDLGINSKNVAQMRKSDNPEIRRFLGVDGEMGAMLKLPKAWSYNIVKHIGNYGESFERHLGSQSPLKIARGYNKLWRDGGLHYPLPVR